MPTLDDPWSDLDYTPITPQAKGPLKKLWRTHDLPEVDLGAWSLEYAREIWEIVSTFTRRDSGFDRDDLLVFLDDMGCWDPTGNEQKWAPTVR